MKEFKVYSVWGAGAPTMEEEMIPLEVFSTEAGATLRCSNITKMEDEVIPSHLIDQNRRPKVCEDTFTLDDDGTISLPEYQRPCEQELKGMIKSNLWQWLKPEDLAVGIIKVIVDNFVNGTHLGESEDYNIAGTELFLHYESPFGFSIIKDGEIVWGVSLKCYLNEKSFTSNVTKLKNLLIYHIALATGVLKPGKGNNEDLPF